MNSKLSLIFSCLRDAGIPDEIICKILYEFKGLSNKCASLLRQPIGITEKFIQKGWSFEKIENFWIMKQTDDNDYYFETKTYQRVRMIEKYTNMKRQLWIDWWNKKQDNKTIKQNRFNKCELGDKSIILNLTDYGNTDQKKSLQLLKLKELQVSLHITSNIICDENRMNRFHCRSDTLITNTLDEMTENLYTEEIDSDEEDGVEEILYDRKWGDTMKKSGMYYNVCDKCEGKFPPIFMREEIIYDRPHDFTELISVGDCENYSETLMCLYCLFEEEHESFGAYKDDIF